MLESLLMSTLCVSGFFFLSDNILHLDVHYVCYTMLVERFEPQGRCFTNFHYYYCYKNCLLLLLLLLELSIIIIIKIIPWPNSLHTMLLGSKLNKASRMQNPRMPG